MVYGTPIHASGEPTSPRRAQGIGGGRLAQSKHTPNDSSAVLTRPAGNRSAARPDSMPRVKIGPAQPDRKTIDIEIARLRDLNLGDIQAGWHTVT